MNFRYFLCSIFVFLLLGTSIGYAQQYQPEDVISTIGENQLKYKHMLAYINIEMEGESPSMLNNKKFMEELTQDLLEEFSEAPEDVVADLNEHYAAMQMGAGYEMEAPGSNAGQQVLQNQRPNSSIGGNGQWKKMLSGSLLYYSTTESYDGIFVQSTQYMHLCPNGMARFYETSSGGGDVGSVGVSAPSQMKFTGSLNWGVTEDGSAAYFVMSDMRGANQEGAFPMRVANNQIVIEGLGAFYLNPGAAVCQ